ncbi:metal dependent phosphohydrolase [Solidesulfovibrio carbinoliphilus subsp. oakridgensis]|uniref:Metal dependent phosphohydrolase n=1 Tax=Solidesulfovibrio carbinoliphilus subsp. oakridgensis TaxID=694327 RepID=G7Q560_9BACT|nr:HDOD domain-containing protein [Solidesulfovibrio carbinoliphilus]EHJ48383.1 metal dependent phosphohydrolase [Solidesulfovibrio carbinoliphilus subsp. oakridgensis]
MSANPVLTPGPDPAARDPAATAGSDFAARFLQCGQPRRAVSPGPVPPPPAPDDLGAAASVSLAEINPPPLPQAFLALRRAAENPMSRVADVATVIAMDPSLAAYVLRLANSALYSPKSRVETVSRAVATIGLGEIETMAAGAMLGRLFEKPPRPDLLRLDDFWRHAVAVGILSRALADRVGERGGERFFVAGLLHDMGRLVLAVAEPGLAASALARTAGGRLPLDAAERLELGFDHAALGGRIVAKWRLPDTLAMAVAGHHEPGLCPDNLMAAAVHAADFMANALGARPSPGTGMPRLDERVLPAFNLAAADPQEFLGILDEGLAAMTALVAP